MATIAPLVQAPKMTFIKQVAESPDLRSIPSTYAYTTNPNEAAGSDPDDSIPIIDFALLTSGDPDQRSKSIIDLTKACQDWGFFMVINHDVPESLMNGVIDTCNEFFNLTVEEKQEFQGKHALDPIRCGTSYNAKVDKVFFWRDFLKAFVHPEFHFPHKPQGFSSSLKKGGFDEVEDTTGNDDESNEGKFLRRSLRMRGPPKDSFAEDFVGDLWHQRRAKPTKETNDAVVQQADDPSEGPDGVLENSGPECLPGGTRDSDIVGAMGYNGVAVTAAGKSNLGFAQAKLNGGDGGPPHALHLEGGPSQVDQGRGNSYVASNAAQLALGAPQHVTPHLPLQTCSSEVGLGIPAQSDTQSMPSVDVVRPKVVEALSCVSAKEPFSPSVPAIGPLGSVDKCVSPPKGPTHKMESSGKDCLHEDLRAGVNASSSHPFEATEAHETAGQAASASGLVDPTAQTHPMSFAQLFKPAQYTTPGSFQLGNHNVNAEDQNRSVGPFCLEYFPHEPRSTDLTVRVPTELIDEGKKDWGSTLVGYFVGKHLPYSLVSTVIHKLWDHRGLVDFLATESGFYFFSFADVETRDAVLVGGPWYVAGQPLVLTPWTTNLTLEKKAVHSLPLWVNLYGIPMELWNPKGLSFIASYLGKPLKVDRMTASRRRISYARVCIEVSGNQDLLSHFTLETSNDNGEPLFTVIKVEYQWTPLRCSKCSSFGHDCSSIVPPTHIPISNSNQAHVAKNSKFKKKEVGVWQVVNRKDNRNMAISSAKVDIPLTAPTCVSNVFSALSQDPSGDCQNSCVAADGPVRSSCSGACPSGPNVGAHEQASREDPLCSPAVDKILCDSPEGLEEVDVDFLDGNPMSARQKKREAKMKFSGSRPKGRHRI